MHDQAHEVQELHESAHEGQHDRTLAPISLTMAIVAVMVAVVSLLGHRAHTEELLLQTESSNRWSYFQAKNIRRHTYEALVDLSATMTGAEKDASVKFRAKYAREAERYAEEQKEIEAEARKAEHEVQLAQRHANRFDLGEVFLEIALVITSITLLTRRRAFWHVGLLLAGVGLVTAASALALR